MERTIVMGCRPQPLVDNPHRVDPAAVPHPPTDDDPTVHVLHVLRFVEGAYGEMETYSRRAAEAAGRHGGGMYAWFDVEGTILGDGRAWDQVRFNDFPSRAAFMAVVTDPDRLRHQTDHRETAIADTYTMILRPVIDRLAASLPPKM